MLTRHSAARESRPRVPRRRRSRTRPGRGETADEAGRDRRSLKPSPAVCGTSNVTFAVTQDATALRPRHQLITPQQTPPFPTCALPGCWAFRTLCASPTVRARMAAAFSLLLLAGALPHAASARPLLARKLLDAVSSPPAPQGPCYSRMGYQYGHRADGSATPDMTVSAAPAPCSPSTEARGISIFTLIWRVPTFRATVSRRPPCETRRSGADAQAAGWWQAACA